MLSGELRRVVVVVRGVESGEDLERWVFNIQTEETEDEEDNQNKGSSKGLEEIHGEIQAIIRQITASVTFLPLLSEEVAFEVLVYTDRRHAIPLLWEESNPRLIQSAQHVKLRSFSTGVHRVEGMVAFKDSSEV